MLLMVGRTTQAIVATLTALVLAAAAPTPALGLDDLSLNVAPGSTSVVPGDTVTVTLDVAIVSATINGVQVLLNYDTTVLSLVAITPSTLSLPVGNGWMEVVSFENAGDIDWAAVITDGETGLDHTIATFTFTAIDEGLTNIAFRASAAPFFTKLTRAADNGTILPNTFDSGTIDTLCDDGVFCNGFETFGGSVCVPGIDPCDDGVPCTDDTCDEVLDTCGNAVNDANCDDGLFCNGAEVCDAALDCQAGSDPCDDAITCTDDSCDDLLDTCTNATNDNLCDNTLFCDGLEFCDAALDCQFGTPPDCDDLVGCTVETCDDFNDVCVNTPRDVLCDNGLFCDGPETCDSVLDCQLAADPCDDVVACTVDTCDEPTDTCLNTPDDVFCSNGLFCDGSEVCDPVLDCVAGTDPCAPLICDEIGSVCLSPIHVANLEVFYSGTYADAADPSRSFLAPGSVATTANMTNYIHGITGIRVTFDAVVSFATTADAALAYEWSDIGGITFSPVTGVASEFTVIEDTSSGVTVLDIVITNDHVRRRWLKVTVDATQVTSSGVELDGELVGNPVIGPSGDGTPGGDAIFFLGSMPGDVTGDRKTTLTDAGQTRLQVNPVFGVPIDNVFDVDKSGKVQLADAGQVRLDVNPVLTLRLIAP